MHTVKQICTPRQQNIANDTSNRFLTGYYGLIIMPTEGQIIFANVIHKVENTFAIIEDIIIVTKGTREQHMKKMEQVLKTLDEARIRLKLEKCQIGKTEKEWPGF